MSVRGIRRARQDGPERTNVLLHRLRLVRPEAFAHRPGHLEVLLDESLEAEPRSGSRGRVAGDDFPRGEPRPGIGERLRVREDPRELDVMEQGAEVVGRVVACAGRWGRAPGRDDKGGNCCEGSGPHPEAPFPFRRPHPLSPSPFRRGGTKVGLGLPSPNGRGDQRGGDLFHLNTIHRTPIVATRTIESTTLRFRGPTGTGIAVISGAPYVSPTVRAAPGGAVIRLTAMRIPEHKTKSNAAKWRKLIVANQYHTEPLVRLARASSSTRRAVPMTSPVQSAARAPVPLSRGYNTPSRKHAAMGGAMYACTLCR